MIYRPRNLTGCVVVLQSKAGIHQFLKDRQRSVESKMRRAIKAGSSCWVPRSSVAHQGDDTDPRSVLFYLIVFVFSSTRNGKW